MIKRHSLSFAMRSRAAVARRAHNPKVLGSIPSFATTKEIQNESLFLFNKLIIILIGIIKSNSPNHKKREQSQ